MFQVLGPLTLNGDGRRLRVPPGRRQTLLAALVLHANRPVPLDVLVTELWGGSPPASAVSNVRSYVCQLRKLLGRPPDEGGERLASDPGGYRLLLTSTELDATQFEDLVADGNAALGRGEPGTAATTLCRALALWRGPALAGTTTGPAASAAVSTLEERRVSAAEDYFAACLAGGHGDLGDLIGRLRAHIARNPLRERARAQLMTALYRAGDASAALAAFAEAREILADELGIAPGQELCATQRAVLARDPALLSADGRMARKVAPPRSRPAPTRGNAPHELPRDVSAFAGRTRELSHIGEALAAGSSAPAVVAIHGPAGAGKSALAVRAAHRAASTYPDGQVYVDLRGFSPGLVPLTPAEVLGHLLRSLDGAATGAVSSSAAEASARLRSLLAERRVLILLDNARDADQLADLLPARGSSAVIVTSRTMLSTLEGRHLRLGALGPAEARSVLGRLAGGERVAAEPEATATVLSLCGHLPLAVRIAGARLARRPDWRVADLARRLGAEHRRLDELTSGGLAVRLSFATSYRCLGSGAEALAFRLLGLVRIPDFTPAVLAALLDVEPTTAEAALDRLVEAQLVEAGTAGRFRLHDLLRLYAAELAEETECDHRDVDPVRRVLEFYTASAEVAADVLRPESVASAGAERGAAGAAALNTTNVRDWFDVERANLIALARQAATTDGLGGYVVRLAHALHTYLSRGGHWRDYQVLAELTLATAERLGDPHGESLALSMRGAHEYFTGRHDEALATWQRSLALCRAHGLELDEARVRCNLGELYRGRGDHDAAVEALVAALHTYRRLGLRVQEGVTLHNIGHVHLSRNDAKGAVAHLEASLAIRRATGDQLGESITLATLGTAYALLGRVDEALDRYRAGLLSGQRSGHRHAEWESLVGAAEVAGRLGRAKEAVHDARLAVLVGRATGDRYREALALHELARAAGAAGRAGPARQLARRAALLLAGQRTRPDPSLERLIGLTPRTYTVTAAPAPRMCGAYIDSA